MHVATRDHLWTNHEVRLENNPVVGPEAVYDKYMQCLILKILIETEGETIKNWALQLLYS